ncbi:hypothetical protein [Paenibacillus sp. KN14-4R]|uniref:hypothetical protein n=1 Tax=Paenibacillus sp. KN14-4R TaxID=3445773 RepID=UPI003FA07322
MKLTFGKKRIVAALLILCALATLPQALASTEEKSDFSNTTESPKPTQSPSPEPTKLPEDQGEPEISEPSNQKAAESPIVAAAANVSGKAVYSYDSSGKLSKIQFPDGKTANYQYDSNNNLLSIEMK